MVDHRHRVVGVEVVLAEAGRVLQHIAAQQQHNDDGQVEVVDGGHHQRQAVLRGAGVDDRPPTDHRRQAIVVDEDRRAAVGQRFRGRRVKLVLRGICRDDRLICLRMVIGVVIT